MKELSTYREQARVSLQNRWNDAAVAMFLIFLISGFCTALSSGAESHGASAETGALIGLGAVISILILSPLGYALYTGILQLSRGDEQSLTKSIFGLFKKQYASYLVASVVVEVFTAVVGVFTLFIGYFILAYAYRMVPYLLRDYPELSTTEAMKTSREMMKGHKMDLFLLDLSFIGWYLLGFVTLCIGLLWVIPYHYTAAAHFYDDLKAETIVEDDEDKAFVE